MIITMMFGDSKSDTSDPTVDESNSSRMSEDEALEELIKGNERFISGKARHQHTDVEWRKRLTADQTPYAMILACNDSRVPVELLFDQGFGDLFVIRVAGNVIGEDEIGSIEYAVVHLKTPLVFVLGHESFGAVTAALAPMAERKKELKGIQKLLTHIDPALKHIDRYCLAMNVCTRV